MPSEIGASRPLPPTPSLRSTQSAAELTLKLAQSLGDLLPPGDKAHAEVLAVRDGQVNFQLLLRLTMASGQQALVVAESPQALPKGSTLQLSTLNQTSLAATLLTQPSLGSLGPLGMSGASQAPLGSLDLDVLPVGTLIQGKVDASQLIALGKAEQVVYKVLVTLLNTPLAGRQLSIESPNPLPLNSLLSARVQDQQALQFLPMNARMDQLDLSLQLGAQQNRQGPLDNLFKALQGSGSNPNLSPELRQSVDKLLGALPDIRQLSDAKGVAQAFQQSGAFLEGQLLRGVEGLPQDLKANLLRLIAQILPTVQGGTAAAVLGNLPGSALAGANNLAQAMPAFVRNALGVIGQTSGRTPPPVSFPLPSRLANELEEEGDLESLLKLAAAAVSRLQTHQLGSLAQSDVLPDGTVLNTWQLEIPLRHQQQMVPIQVRIQQEEKDSPASEREQQPREMLWRVDLAFDLDSLGPLQVQATLAHGSIGTQLWAERAATASLIDGELGTLRQRLNDAGLSVGELSCRQGKPPQGARTAVEQRWVDETA
ncbi:flagellar hook-length control protein FliK [Pseudomonas sp. LABIM340]|uniref:Flagellar hook-length control protein FliK n=1 Tax=Pseudomonas nitroreducens TaxID=46680 RepID=A0A5R9A0K7_PSENT|nr:flagellar hook-length control protein FliK [Pseudomonas nitroreducens]TLP72221.1 flagellar hook-length control protein FliK [Pseudomonas nitroreducens]